MKHYSNDDWVDFVNEVTPPDQREAMQRHLDSDCRRCAKTLALWQRVREAGMAEVAYQPPAGALRTVKAAFEGRSFAQPAGGIVRLFDSFLQPALAGTRSSTSAARHVLYRIGPFLLDMCIEPVPEHNQIAVAGQLLDSGKPERPLAAVSLALSNRKGSLVRTETNQFGEFRCQLDNSGDLELKLPGQHGEEIVVSLSEVLGSQPGGAQ